MLKPKWIVELEKENVELRDEAIKLADENAGLKNELKFTDVIIQDLEGKINQQKEYIKELRSELNAKKTEQIRAEINIRTPRIHNERGAGRKSRANNDTLKMIKSYKNQGFSLSEIADKMTQITNKPWSRSTISYLLGKLSN